MPNFLFVFHGGKMPDTPEEGAREMEAWQQWYADMGEAVVDGGAPVGKSKTVSAQGVADDGGSNPASGYTIVSADSIDAAVELAKGCPILKHGNVEVAGCIDM
ncbi:YciI family protein [Neptunicoccus cionae]|uniref:YciI family protein n=1 Tax=Neptunicoccus cionae TaxID=2035344 RepID=UPI000C7881BF|nr:YciI family protein [Amylibacter cionae]PLS20057.1 hypothetical protein C0U40_18820 [Amylibacter cionae]